MKKVSFVGIVLCITMLPFVSFGQKSSGTIDYSMTMQRRSSDRQGSNQQGNRPQQFTMLRQLTFNADAGKFASAKSKGKGHHRMGSEFINFKNQEFLRAFKKRDNDTTYYMSRPFKKANDFTLTGKTKKLLGYNCQEATAKFGKGKVTLWFTKDLPFTFSPMNGTIPPKGGVVLDIKNDRMHFQATKVDLKDVTASSVSIPSPSHQLTKAELEKARHGMRSRRAHHKKG